MPNLNGFVEVSGYSSTDLQNAVDQGYQDCKDDMSEITITENRTYDAEIEGVVGWKKIVSNVSPNLMQKVITENGFYDASDDDNVDGYSSVEVAVPGGGGGGPFTVRFFDDNNQLIQTSANVPYKGYASCNLLDGTILNGLYFKGWNPSPTGVTEDMNCYPVRGDYQIDSQEIQDSWETICADCGAHYPLGSYKSLVVTIPARSPIDPIWWNTYNDGKMGTWGNVRHNSFQIAMQMVKVAEGEDGTSSSWLSEGVIPVHPYWDNGDMGYDQINGIYKANGIMNQGGSGNYTPVWMDWGDSPQREYLNNFLIGNIPESLSKTIKSVNKQFATFSRSPVHTQDVGNPYDTKLYKTSIDKIWVPSLKELHSYFSSFYSWSQYSDAEEINGIDYSAVYMPSYPDKFFTRSIYIGGNYLNSPTKVGNSITANTQNTPGCPIGFCL